MIFADATAGVDITTLFGVLTPGTSVAAVIAVVVLFLRHLTAERVRTSEMQTAHENHQKEMQESAERHQMALTTQFGDFVKILSETQRDFTKSITDRVDRLIDKKGN